MRECGRRTNGSRGLKKKHANTRRKLSALEAQIATTLEELERALSDMTLLQHDMAHCQDAIKQTDQ